MEEQRTLAEVGRDYERFIGYLYETAGWAVVYRGILRGKADRGRDLVCWNGSKVQIVQCKRWALSRPIDSSIVGDLIRTTKDYITKKHTEDQLNFGWPEAEARTVRAVLFTTSVLQSDAKAMANANDVKFRERYPIQEYPRIKCYRTSLGEKVYLTPHCYSYDSVAMKCMNGDCYVYSENEALELGFIKHEERTILCAAPRRPIERIVDSAIQDGKPSFWARLEAWLFGLKHRL